VQPSATVHVPALWHRTRPGVLPQSARMSTRTASEVVQPATVALATTSMLAANRSAAAGGSVAGDTPEARLPATAPPRRILLDRPPGEFRSAPTHVLHAQRRPRALPINVHLHLHADMSLRARGAPVVCECNGPGYEIRMGSPNRIAPGSANRIRCGSANRIGTGVALVLSFGGFCVSRALLAGVSTPMAASPSTLPSGLSHASPEARGGADGQEEDRDASAAGSRTAAL